MVRDKNYLSFFNSILRIVNMVKSYDTTFIPLIKFHNNLETLLSFSIQIDPLR